MYTALPPVLLTNPLSRCPHIREVCRNRTYHPRIDVLFLKNAEVDCFNGCGYCKWARTNPPSKSAGYNNPGWPGCCRPPAPTEHRMIQLAEWKSVSMIHHVPIPPEVKATLDSLSACKPSPAPSSTAARSPTSPRPSMPVLDRKNSAGGSPPTKSSIVPVRASGSSLAAKSRSGASPKLAAASLSGSLSRSTGSTLSSSSPPMDQIGSRRAPISDATDKSRSTHHSPSRKQPDLDNSATPRRNSASRSSTSPSTPTSKPTPETTRTITGQSPERRRTTPSSAPASSPTVKTSATSRPSTGDRSAPAATTQRTPKKDDNMSSAASSAGSESRSSDFSDSTITSDGGFTDYLSDESEAELQRQAEAKAALIAQMQAEESEFKAARQQLAHVDLRPPKSWTPTNITNNTARLAQASGAKG
ncbi:hypothetical protein D9758_001159 [Tetrapyrgos nigripes]|uniref:Uncharacterized protein n=1 Tax=Tetrapyrgos nigripes TaxID=182062 RepID=A0A8H5GR78_9AGAR|nr:hypothetical protein D9758_001159 [Tetrapyrgos nigripes]